MLTAIRALVGRGAYHAEEKNNGSAIAAHAGRERNDYGEKRRCVVQMPGCNANIAVQGQKDQSGAIKPENQA